MQNALKYNPLKIRILLKLMDQKWGQNYQPFVNVKVQPNSIWWGEGGTASTISWCLPVIQEKVISNQYRVSIIDNHD